MRFSGYGYLLNKSIAVFLCSKLMQTKLTLLSRTHKLRQGLKKAGFPKPKIENHVSGTLIAIYRNVGVKDTNVGDMPEIIFSFAPKIHESGIRNAINTTY